MSRQCGQCQRPDCPVSVTDSPVPDADARKWASLWMHTYWNLHGMDSLCRAAAIVYMQICRRIRYGVKSAVCVARARKAEGCFLEDSDIPWGQQVELEELKGMSPNVQ